MNDDGTTYRAGRKDGICLAAAWLMEKSRLVDEAIAGEALRRAAIHLGWTPDTPLFAELLGVWPCSAEATQGEPSEAGQRPAKPGRA